MQVVLQVVSGTDSGRKVWLMPNQRVRVGATEWADFAVANDSGLSSVHFSLRCGPDSCHLFDLQSEFGTFVNGQRISSFTDLADGDVIRASLTRFRVQFSDSRPQEAAASQETASHETA